MFRKFIDTFFKGSRTHFFNVVMGAIQAINASLFLVKSVVSPETFAIIALVIGMTHSVGGYILRELTTGPVE